MAQESRESVTPETLRQGGDDDPEDDADEDPEDADEDPEDDAVRTLSRDELFRIVTENFGKIPPDNLTKFLNKNVRHDVFENVPTMVTLITNVFELTLQEVTVDDYSPQSVPLTVVRERRFRIHDPIVSVVDLVVYDRDTVVATLKTVDDLSELTPENGVRPAWRSADRFQVCVLNFGVEAVYRLHRVPRPPKIFVRKDLLILQMGDTEIVTVVIYKIPRHGTGLRFQTVHTARGTDPLSRYYFSDDRLTILSGADGRVSPVGYSTVELDVGAIALGNPDLGPEFITLDDPVHLENGYPNLTNERLSPELDLFGGKSNSVGDVAFLPTDVKHCDHPACPAPHDIGTLLPWFPSVVVPEDGIHCFDSQERLVADDHASFMRRLQMNSSLVLHYNSGALMSPHQVAPGTREFKGDADNDFPIEPDLAMYKLVFEMETITGMTIHTLCMGEHQEHHYLFKFNLDAIDYHERSDYHAPTILSECDKRSRLIVSRPERNTRYHRLVSRLSDSLHEIGDPLGHVIIQLVVDYC